MSDMMGKVWLVGAGPGDAGLFTRKGYEVLQQVNERLVFASISGYGQTGGGTGGERLHCGQLPGRVYQRS